MSLEKIDLKKEYKDLYRATAKVKEVKPGKGTFIAVEDKGVPGGEAYQNAIDALYSVAYTVKFTLKGEGTLDFGVPCLECLYFDDPTKVAIDNWHWQLMIRIPPEVKANHIKAAAKVLREKKDKDVSMVKRITFAEGPCLQTLHVGPYDDVGGTYEMLQRHAADAGLDTYAPCHEVYISDPRRTAPEKLKTVVRVPVGKKRA